MMYSETVKGGKTEEAGSKVRPGDVIVNYLKLKAASLGASKTKVWETTPESTLQKILVHQREPEQPDNTDTRFNVSVETSDSAFLSQYLWALQLSSDNTLRLLGVSQNDSSYTLQMNFSGDPKEALAHIEKNDASKAETALQQTAQIASQKLTRTRL